jgi:transposase
MRFYHKQHKYYCGIDLHTRKMYVCIIDNTNQILFHRNLRTDPDTLRQALDPYIEDVVVGVECTFSWYWVADLCSRESIPFVLGHALYMKAIHGAKTKNDRIDSQKIAFLLRGGNFPLSYAYPAEMRSTRDLLRRRMYMMRKRSELLVHIENTRTQYNLPAFGKKITYRANRDGVENRFADPSVQKSIEVNLKMIEAYEKILSELELFIEKHAKVHDPQSLYLLKTIPGVGKILSLAILYEIHDINRFPRVQEFSSYARLIKPKKESAGKVTGASNKKIGNALLKWAFSEAVVHFVRDSEEVKKHVQRLEGKHGKGKAISILTKRLGCAAYFMLKNKKAFDMKKFLKKG